MFQDLHYAQPPRTISKPIHTPYIERSGVMGDVAHWVAFIVLLVSTITFVGLGQRTTKKNRAFHYISAVAALVSTLSYYALSTGSGSVFIYKGLKFVQGREISSFRQVPYARYVDAALSTPMILFELGLFAGLSWVDIGTMTIANEVWVLTQLFAGLSSRGTAMWGWYAFSCVFLIYIISALLWTGRKTSRLQADHVPKLYTGISLIIGVVWILYTVVFALGNGTNVVNLDSEMIIYVVLDVIAKSAVGFLLIFAHAKHSDNHTGTIPEYLVEPRAFRRIRLPGADD